MNKDSNSEESLTDIASIIMLAVFVILLSYLIIAGVWWTVLWSFSFPIAFAWKQTLGIWIVYAVLNPDQFKKD
jgi:hypothetical protein